MTMIPIQLSAADRITVEEPDGIRRYCWNALGTRCEIQYVCADEARARTFETHSVSWVADFEAKYSRFRPGSLVSRINAAAGKGWVAIDAEMEQFFDLSGSLYQLSSGALDVTALPLMQLWDYKSVTPRIPSDYEIASALKLVGWRKVERRPGFVRLPEAGMAIDFGGWGKEYAVDMVAQIARNHGLTQVLVDFGRDLFALGSAPSKPAWHIGLEDPAKPGIACWGSIAVKDCAVASSGDYLRGFTLNGQRFGHIVDPRTGWPVRNGCRQTTVVASTCLQAGSLSTAAFILGAEKGTLMIDQIMGPEACIITSGARYQTKGFFKYVLSK